MAYVSMKQMLETGVHFGHQTRRWNPKMRPFIFGARNGIHIIDLQQSVNRYQKKEILTLQREMAKLELTLGGIKDMDRLPQLAFIIDPNREEIAVKECRKLGIPIVAVTDTNCDPDVIDYIIPGNDDAIRAIKLFVTAMAEACLEGEAMRKGSKNKDAEEELKKAADAEAKAEEAPAVEAAAE